MTSSHSDSPHSDVGPELRQLAQTILDRLDPAVRSAAAMAAESLRGPGRCQQVWCPVCALVALVNGEQHPMLNVIAEHSVTLMTMIRAMAADPQAKPAAQNSDAEKPAAAGEPTEAPSDPAQNGSGRSGSTRYQHIQIVVENGSEG